MGVSLRGDAWGDSRGRDVARPACSQRGVGKVTGGGLRKRGPGPWSRKACSHKTIKDGSRRRDGWGGSRRYHVLRGAEKRTLVVQKAVALGNETLGKQGEVSNSSQRE